MFEFQRKGLIFTRTICSVFSAISRNVCQKFETEADAEYWEMRAPVIDSLRNSN